MFIQAAVAELADALDSGSSEGNFMEVQVLSAAPLEREGFEPFFISQNEQKISLMNKRG